MFMIMILELESSAPDTAAPSIVLTKSEAGACRDADSQIDKVVMHSLPAPPDVLLLDWTPVRDGVVPGGLEHQFAPSETAIKKRAARALKRSAGADNLSSAVWLHQRHKASQQKLRSESSQSISSCSLRQSVRRSSERDGKRSSLMDQQRVEVRRRR